MSERLAFQTRTVVVVEDDPLLRDLAATELRDAGFRVVEFATADAALNHLAFHAAETAAVFTDVQMPGCINGLELTAIVARSWTSVAILVTSGGSLVNPVRLPPRCQFVAKPWRGADIVRRIEALTQAEPVVARLRLDAAML